MWPHRRRENGVSRVRTTSDGDQRPIVELGVFARIVPYVVALVVGAAGGTALILSRGGCSLSAADMAAHAATMHQGTAEKLKALEQSHAVTGARLEGLQKQVDRVEGKIDRILARKAQP